MLLKLLYLLVVIVAVTALAVVVAVETMVGVEAAHHLTHVGVQMSCVLMEQRILLHYEFLDRICAVAEALTSLIFPFVWSHVYVPLLPLQVRRSPCMLWTPHCRLASISTTPLYSLALPAVPLVSALPAEASCPNAAHVLAAHVLDGAARLLVHAAGGVPAGPRAVHHGHAH
jgi:hypothetical protein